MVIDITFIAKYYIKSEIKSLLLKCFSFATISPRPATLVAKVNLYVKST